MENSISVCLDVLGKKIIDQESDLNMNRFTIERLEAENKELRELNRNLAATCDSFEKALAELQEKYGRVAV